MNSLGRIFHRLTGNSTATVTLPPAQDPAPALSTIDSLTLEKDRLNLELQETGQKIATFRESLKSVEGTMKTANILTFAGFGAMSAAAFLGASVLFPMQILLGGMVTAAGSFFAKLYLSERACYLHGKIGDAMQSFGKAQALLQETSQKLEAAGKAKTGLTEMTSNLTPTEESISEGEDWIEINGLRLEKNTRGSLHYFNDLFGDMDKNRAH